VTGVKVTAFDIAGGVAREDLGTFESIQVTGREVRDQDDHVILRFFDECWFSTATGNGWYDFTIEAVA
jgi:hypothetical protein